MAAESTDCTHAGLLQRTLVLSVRLPSIMLMFCKASEPKSARTKTMGIVQDTGKLAVHRTIGECLAQSRGEGGWQAASSAASQIDGEMRVRWRSVFRPTTQLPTELVSYHYAARLRTSSAALSPERTAPSISPCISVARSAPAQ